MSKQSQLPFASRMDPYRFQHLPIPISLGVFCSIQSTLRQPEVHILYVQFNITCTFVLRAWEIMICTPHGEPQKINKKRKAVYFDRAILAFSKVSIASVIL